MNIVMNELPCYNSWFCKSEGKFVLQKKSQGNNLKCMEILNERGKACLVIVLVILQKEEK